METKAAEQMRNGGFPAISVNKDVTDICSSSSPMQVCKGTQKGEEYLKSSSRQDCSHSYSEAQGTSGCKKKQPKQKTTEMWPRIPEMHMKGMI